MASHRKHEHAVGPAKRKRKEKVHIYLSAIRVLPSDFIFFDENTFFDLLGSSALAIAANVLPCLETLLYPRLEIRQQPLGLMLPPSCLGRRRRAARLRY